MVLAWGALAEGPISGEFLASQIPVERFSDNLKKKLVGVGEKDIYVDVLRSFIIIKLNLRKLPKPNFDHFESTS